MTYRKLQTECLRRSRRTRRTRHARRTRRARRTQGGSGNGSVNHNASCKNLGKFYKNGTKEINWPNPNLYPDGCEKNPTIITVSEGDKFDRFGSEFGNFGSPLSDNGKYSYESRALPYMRKTNNSDKSCSNVYQIERKEKNDYHVYEVLKPIPGVKECNAVAAFGKKGGAVQWKFPISIKKMLEDGMIKRIENDIELPPFN